MDLYLPTDFRHLHDDPDHADWGEPAPAVPADALWLGGEAYIPPTLFAATRTVETKQPRHRDDPIWRAI